MYLCFLLTPIKIRLVLLFALFYVPVKQGRALVHYWFWDLAQTKLFWDTVFRNKVWGRNKNSSSLRTRRRMWNKMKRIQYSLQDILSSYLYPFRSVKDMKGSGWGIFYGLSHVFMAGDSDWWHICLKWHLSHLNPPAHHSIHVCCCFTLYHFLGLGPA